MSQGEVHLYHVEHVDRCDLTVAPGPWEFREGNLERIAAHWRQRTEENPAFFNGQILLMSSYTCADGVLTGRFRPVDFASYLFWRDTGKRDLSVTDAFGSSILCSGDGAILLGRQSAGNLNSGLVYPPGGFVDQRDVGPQGGIDITASMCRELEEEMGLDGSQLAVAPGYDVAFCGRQIAISRRFSTPEVASDLVSRVRRHIAADPNPEIEDVVVIRSQSDLDRHAVPPYARVLLGYLLDR